MAFGKKNFGGNKERPPLVNVAGFWPTKSGNGYSGKFERDTAEFEALVEKHGLQNVRLLILENDKRQNERQPVLRLLASAPDEQPAATGKAFGGSKPAAAKPAPAKKAAPKKLPWQDDSDGDDDADGGEGDED